MYFFDTCGKNILIEVISLTNINCTLDCIYQIEGKCSYDIISNSNLCTNSECAYFKKMDRFFSAAKWTGYNLLAKRDGSFFKFCPQMLQKRTGPFFHFYISSITFAKYFILFRHCSKVFPVAPTSMIHAALPKC